MKKAIQLCCLSFSILLINLKGNTQGCVCNSAILLTTPDTDCTGKTFGTASFTSGNLEDGCLQPVYTECGQNISKTLWFEITTDSCAKQLLVDVDPAENWIPKISVYQGDDCADLSSLPFLMNPNQPCGSLVGSSVTGIYSVLGQTTYWIAISRNIDVTNSDFHLEISTTAQYISCLQQDQTNFTLNGNPIGGALWDPQSVQNQLTPGEEYEICLDFLYNSTNSNNVWLHGIIPNFGPAWDLSSFNPNSASISPSSSFGPNGQDVSWYNNVVLQEPVPNLCTYINSDGNLELCNDLSQSCPCTPGLAVGDNLPPGWFWISSGSAMTCTNDGTLAESWGIGATMINISICFDLKVKEFTTVLQCENENDLMISFMPFSDGMTGCWEDNTGECQIDFLQFINLKANCSLNQTDCTDTLQVYSLCEESISYCSLSDIHNKCFDMPEASSNATGPMPLCPDGGVPDNMVWFSFIAPEVPIIEFLITADDCSTTGGTTPGIQYGIYTNCDFDNSIICSPDCGPLVNATYSVVLSQGSFIPGQEYWFFIDGCTTTTCSILIEVIEGGNKTFQYPDPTNILCQDCEVIDSMPAGNISTSYSVCSFANIELEITDEYNFFDSFESENVYSWHSTPNIPSLSQLTDTNLQTILSSTTPGIYEICAQIISDCAQTSEVCIELEIKEVPTIPIIDYTISMPYQILFCWNDIGAEIYDPILINPNPNHVLNYDAQANPLCCTVNGVEYLDSVELIVISTHECDINTALGTCVMDVCFPEYQNEYYLDEDGDGFGNPDTSIIDCIAPLDYVENNTDCNDNDSTIYPGANELCDNLDNNCNDVIDEDVVFQTYFEDSDGDGFGNPDVSIEDCMSPMSYVENNDDCDDNNAELNPNATEVCDTEDNNCNGEIDEGLTFITYYQDMDGDGFGNPDVSIEDCMSPIGYVENNDDCDDDNAEINPDATEVCDTIDNNCNDEVDEGLAFTTYYQDMDGDGFGDPEFFFDNCAPVAGFVENGDDCDDTNPDINPEAEEIPNNGIDEDCDGLSSAHELDNYLVKIYPNPANAIIYIEINSEVDFQTKLFAMDGKLILETTTSVLDVSAYANGMYLIEIKDLKTNKRLIERIVINK